VGARVVAVVVTWNRRLLLARLLRAVAAGTRRPDAVLVVDNASTDGSAEMVGSLDLPVPVRVLTLPTNTGGAGGFHAGLREVVAGAADLAWLMDDDGVPEPDCLEVLLRESGRLDFWGPAVVAEDDPGRLCFPIRLPGTARVLHRTADAERATVDGVLPDVVIPFNGVLVSADLVRRIGLPRQEFFIWGDDVEYLWRARAAGARVGTVTRARFAHPSTDDLGTPMMWGRTTYNHSGSDLKHYCMVRNNLTNLRAYSGALGVVAFVVKTVWFYLFTRPQPARLALSARAAWAAVRGDFTGHRRYLP
jgi:rhamnopyranosyl-N-acetylglucosaminyl-diphospho-decaprenol beta-1,3/1,4-galactofuranosyltransferase